MQPMIVPQGPGPVPGPAPAVFQGMPSQPGAQGIPGQPSQVPANAQPASMDPNQMTEGGGPPVGQNLTVKEATIGYFDYGGKAPQTVASKIVFVNDAGEVLSPQHYSIGDPTRFMPSADGKQVLLLGQASGISKSSNHGVLMASMVNAGFPVDQLSTGDISVIVGLYAYWDGVPEPPRAGLQRTDAQKGRNNVICVPTLIHRLPWENNTGAVAQPASQAPVAPAAPMAPAMAPQAPMVSQTPPAPVPVAAVPVAGVNTTDFGPKALGLAQQLGGNFTIQQVMNGVYSSYANDPDRDNLATYVFSPEFTALLQGQGYNVQGHNVTR